MSFAQTFLFNKVISEGGIELLLANAVQVPQYFASTTQVGNVLVGVPDNATIKKIGWGSNTNLTTVGNSITLHDEETDSNYSLPATGTHKVILVITNTSSAANVKFKVWSHGTADTTPGSGTPQYDFNKSSGFSANARQTTKILTGFTASQHINIELEAASTGGIANVEGWVVEIPA